VALGLNSGRWAAVADLYWEGWLKAAKTPSKPQQIRGVKSQASSHIRANEGAARVYRGLRRSPQEPVGASFPQGIARHSAAEDPKATASPSAPAGTGSRADGRV
jgi:hypothetical protein